MGKKLISYLNLGLCIIFWASAPVAAKKILVELDNLQTLFYSTLLSFLVIGIIVVAQKKIKELKRTSAKDFLAMGILGFLGSYLFYVFLYGALSLTTASEAFVLDYTWPVMVLILAFALLKEKITIQKILAILIGFFGIVVIVTNGKLLSLNVTSVTGDILALLGAFTFALFSVLGKKFNFDKTVSVFVYFLSALFFVTLTVLMFSSIPWPSASIWPWLLYNGILVNGVTYIFWFNALEHGDTHIISNALYLTPFLSLVYIWLLLDEKILPSSIVGLLIIVAGIVVSYGGSKKTSIKAISHQRSADSR